MLDKVNGLPDSVHKDIEGFINDLEQEPLDQNSLKTYGLKNDEVVAALKHVFMQ